MNTCLYLTIFEGSRKKKSSSTSGRATKALPRPLFDDQMECKKWSKLKNIAFLELSEQKNLCFDMPQVYRSKK